MGTLIGLGLTNQKPSHKPEQLMEAVMEEDETCGKYNHDIGGLTNRELQICYSAPGIVSACDGDSGGPLVYTENGKPVCLLGIATFTWERCWDPDYPCVFIAVGILRNWIIRQLKLLY